MVDLKRVQVFHHATGLETNTAEFTAETFDDPATFGPGGGGAAISNVIYPVFVGGPFPSIGAAIAAAVADGHTTIENAALVLVSPKPGGWVEDVILTAGVNVQGLWEGDPYSVLVAGKVSFTPGIAATQKVYVEGIYVNPGGVGVSALELLGVNVGHLYVKNCVVDKAEPTAPNVLVSGSVGSRLFIQDCIGNLVAGGTAWDVESGLLQATNCDISKSTAARGLKIGATGVARFFNVNLQAAGPDVVLVASGGSYAFENVILTQATVGNSGIVELGIPPFVTGFLIFCLFNVPAGAGYAIKGTGLVLHASNAFVANVKYQVPGLTLVPLAILPVPTP